MTNKSERPKVYGCAECGKLFSRPSLRDQHFRVHSGERPFKCNVCGQAFMRSDHLQRHNQLKHGEDPRLECEVCRKKFHLPQHLKAHMGLHSANKFCPRDGCDKAFRTAPQLRRHLNEHDLVCECGLSFTSEKKLAFHNSRHHGDYLCGLCGFSAPSWARLQEHLRDEVSCSGKVALDQKRAEIRKPFRFDKANETIAMVSGISYSQRPIACPLEGCVFRFLRQYDLDRHLKTHQPLDVTETPSTYRVCVDPLITLEMPMEGVDGATT